MNIEEPEAERAYEVLGGRVHHTPSLAVCNYCGREFTPTLSDLNDARAEERLGEYPHLYCPACRSRDFE
jgi:hypothetical protein